MPSLLTVDALVAGYQVPVVGPLSLTLAAGEVVALNGPNGSGKSTVLAALLGNARCFSGRVSIAAAARLAWLSQRSPLDEPLPMTAAEYLALADADTSIVPAELRALLGYRVDRLSGGQRQMLRICAAMGQPANLVLLDEPTNNLDPRNSEYLVEMLRARSADRAVLLVCHEADLVARVASREVNLS